MNILKFSERGFLVVWSKKYQRWRFVVVSTSYPKKKIAQCIRNRIAYCWAKVPSIYDLVPIKGGHLTGMLRKDFKLLK